LSLATALDKRDTETVLIYYSIKSTGKNKKDAQKNKTNMLSPFYSDEFAIPNRSVLFCFK